MEEGLRLYVWRDVLCDYTCGVAFAIAPDADTARRLICEKYYADQPGAAPRVAAAGKVAETFPASRFEIVFGGLKEDPLVIEGPYAFYIYGGS